jgi:Ca2+-binding EF-hand superfamily protein
MNFKLRFVITAEEIDEIFNIIDKSSNGVITLDELIVTMK